MIGTRHACRIIVRSSYIPKYNCTYLQGRLSPARGPPAIKPMKDSSQTSEPLSSSHASGR